MGTSFARKISEVTRTGGGITPTPTIKGSQTLASLPSKVRERVFVKPEEFGKQPTHKLQEQDYKKIFKAMAMAESGGKLDATNTLGYVGKYQFGAAALETVGYLKPGTWKNRGKKGNASLLSNPSNWLGGTDAGGNKRPSSLEEYMSNAKMQEIGMFKLSQVNRATLIKKLGKDVWEGLSKHERAFMIGGSHLSGATSMANQFKSGSFQTTDAYGTTSAHHGNLAAKSLGAWSPNQSGDSLNSANITFGQQSAPIVLNNNVGNTTVLEETNQPFVNSGSTATDTDQSQKYGALGWVWRKWNN